MRVLHIDLGREFRGGQHQVLLLLKALREAGHESTLLVRADSPIADPAFELGFPVKLASPFALQRFSYQHDVVHAHDAQSHTWAAILCRRPFVVSRRVAFPVSRSPLSRWKYGRPARFLAVSNFVASELQAAGVAQSKIDVVYDSLDVPPRRHEWHAGGPVVTLGSHDPKKGRDLVERASTIAGIPIHFSDDLPEDLATASVFVYISRSEGLGSAALLAMSMGVPVVASRIGGLMEVFEHGISGISVENNPEEIAAAITRVRSDVGLAKALAGAARTRIETMFSTKELVNKTLASYRRAIAG